MIVNLLIGFPDQRPGGLLLSILTAIGSGAGALVLGIVYATVCVQAPRLSLAVQAALAVLRGVPLLLLVFILAQTTRLPLPVAGLAALFLYSLSHVGEALRAFLAAYPSAVRDQARLLGLSWGRELIELRIPWSLRRSLEALATHWISLLKDTGALTVLGIGELTTVARVLSERASISDWQLVLGTAALLYLGATVTLTRILKLLRARYSLGGAVST
jgi:ABC-type amino acid transport system permease subunit